MKKLSNKSIIIILITSIIILSAIVCLILLDKDKPEEVHFTTESFFEKENEIIQTPIKNDNISEEIKDSELLNPDVNISKDNTDITEADDVVVAEFKNIWEDVDLLSANKAILYNYEWDYQLISNPISQKRNMHLLTLYLNYDKDPNEKKEEVIYLINNFSENNNIVFKQNETIKNLIDIPTDGVYLLGDNEKDYSSIRIYSLDEENKIVKVTISYLNKANQILKNSNSSMQKEIDDIKNIYSRISKQIELDIIIRNQFGYIKEFNDVGFDKDDENLTPEQRNLLISAGLY